MPVNVSFVFKTEILTEAGHILMKAYFSGGQRRAAYV